MGFPYISRVEIENFRNLHGLKADFSQSAVIVGENCSGKSNLVHALRLVLDPSLSDSVRELRAEDFWDGLPQPFGGHRIVVRVFLRGFEGSEEAEAVLADCVVEKAPMTACLTYVWRPRSTIETETLVQADEDDYEHVVYGGDDEAHGVGREVRRWLSLTVLPAMRDAESQLSGARRPLLQPLIDRVRPLVDAATLTAVRAELDKAATHLLAEKALRELQDRINERIREIIGVHQSVATKFDFAASDPEQLLRSLRLFLEDGKTRSIADASLGTANVIFLCLLLQDLDERRAKRTSAGTVLAVEEPEAHLHPHLQRLLFRYALRREHSVLVTTHSPHVASVAPLASVMVLRADGAGKTRASRLCAAGGLKLESSEVADLERYLDVTRAEMLFSKGIVFVEGAAEQFLVPAFAGFEMRRRGLGSSLDEIGITVCSVAGTHFGCYWRVTSESGWNIPRVVITDGDPVRLDDGSIRSAGLVRGARLLGDPDLEGKAANGDDKTVRIALEFAGVFVGESTLERELVDSLGEEMKEAFAEIVGGKKKVTSSFRKAVALTQEGDEEAGDQVVGLIDEKIGKGRFAQRLASKITEDHATPQYIRAALERIFELVPHA